MNFFSSVDQLIMPLLYPNSEPKDRVIILILRGTLRRIWKRELRFELVWYNLAMTRQKAIDIWIEGAVDALDTCGKLFKSKKYHHALFFLHLALEKIIKALYISKLDDSPPYTHNLKQLIKLSKIEVSDLELKQLDEISKFNVAARYDDYKYQMYKKATEDYTKKWMKVGKDLYEKYKKNCK